MSLLSFKGGLLANFSYLFNFSNISNNSTFLSFISLESGKMIQRSVTILSLIKVIIQQNQLSLSPNIVEHFSIIYIIMVCLLFLPVFVYILFIEKELWKTVALLTFSMLLLPNISADYKLLHIFLPIFLFINSKESSRLDLFYLLMFGLLMIQKNYFYLSGISSDAGWHDLSTAVLVNIIVMLLTGCVIMISGFIKWKRDRKIQLQIQPVDAK
jgi:hypothetical protein